MSFSEIQQFFEDTNDVRQQLTNLKIVLDDNETNVLQGIIRKGTAERRMVDRARMLLWSSVGDTPSMIAKRLGCSRAIIVNTLQKFITNRQNGLPNCLEDLPRTGRPRIPKLRISKQAF